MTYSFPVSHIQIWTLEESCPLLFLVLREIPKAFLESMNARLNASKNHNFILNNLSDPREKEKIVVISVLIFWI